MIDLLYGNGDRKLVVIGRKIDEPEVEGRLAVDIDWTGVNWKSIGRDVDVKNWFYCELMRCMDVNNKMSALPKELIDLTNKEQYDIDV